LDHQIAIKFGIIDDKNFLLFPHRFLGDESKLRCIPYQLTTIVVRCGS
jgi:hypothetical protein